LIFRHLCLVFALLFTLTINAAASTESNSTPESTLSASFVSTLKTALDGIARLAFGGEETPAQQAPAPAPSRPAEFALRIPMTPEVQRYVAYYAEGRGRKTTVEALARSTSYCERAKAIFAEEGVPTELVWLAQVESEWKLGAVSPVGAGGIWQFMPDTARDFEMRVDDEVDERLDFEKATRGSARYLARLARRYDGNWELAIAAYNVGEGNVDKAIEKAGGIEDFSTLCRYDLLPEETENYVPKVLAVATIGTSPDRYGLPSAG
jgi:membrane-bound lytic murein transglycosylase D